MAVIDMEHITKFLRMQKQAIQAYNRTTPPGTWFNTGAFPRRMSPGLWKVWCGKGC